MILFLDFDGVLHPAVANDAGVFCCLPVFWDILRARPTVEVVFSTSWREIYDPEIMLDFVTSNGGEDLLHRYVGSNPRLIQEPGAYVAGRVYTRQAECVAWLHGNGLQAERWLALEDIAQWFTHPSPTFYLVDHLTGLTDADVPKILERLA